MRLSKRATYAIRALIFLGEGSPNEPVSCKTVSTTLHIPNRFLLQILGQLASYGLLGSTRGVDGGYVLKKEIHQITMFDVLDAIGESELMPEDEKVQRVDAAHDESQRKMRHLHSELHKVLQQFKIAQYDIDTNDGVSDEPASDEAKTR